MRGLEGPEQAYSSSPREERRPVGVKEQRERIVNGEGGDILRMS